MPKSTGMLGKEGKGAKKSSTRTHLLCYSCRFWSMQGGPVRFGCGLGMERFERFRFSVLAVLLQKGFFCVSVQFNRKGRFRFRFLAVPVPLSVSGKTVPTVPVSGSGSVPEPYCQCALL